MQNVASGIGMPVMGEEIMPWDGWEGRFNQSVLLTSSHGEPLQPPFSSRKGLRNSDAWRTGRGPSGCKSRQGGRKTAEDEGGTKEWGG